MGNVGAFTTKAHEVVTIQGFSCVKLDVKCDHKTCKLLLYFELYFEIRRETGRWEVGVPKARKSIKI